MSKTNNEIPAEVYIERSREAEMTKLRINMNLTDARLYGHEIRNN